MAVLATGNVDVYTPGGKYQLYVEKLQPEGVGALQLAFEQMVKRLRAEGLFEEKYKKALPAYPQKIGILSSESGAAVHDITDSIFRRWPAVKLFLYPVSVQGEGAAQEIATAINDVNRRNDKLKLDILIVGRGGGSLEDLWAFNEEVLVRAIFNSRIPVISAVGHEVDVTIADLAADARASTPTKAGVIAVPDREEVMLQLNAMQNRLTDNIGAKLRLAVGNLRTILASSVFTKPLLPIRNAQQQVDELSGLLADSARTLFVAARGRLDKNYEQILRIEPHRLLGEKKLELNNIKNRTKAAIEAIVNACRLKLAAQSNRLEALNPKSVLKRGYSITTSKKSGALVRSSADVRIGDLVVSELADENFIESKVTKK